MQAAEEKKGVKQKRSVRDGDDQRAARSSGVCDNVAAASAAPGEADASQELRVTLLLRGATSLCVTERTVDTRVPKCQPRTD